jgi:hypothetical protein
MEEGRSDRIRRDKPAAFTPEDLSFDGEELALEA